VKITFPELPLASDDLATVQEGIADLVPNLSNCHFLISGGTGFFGRWILESLLYANLQRGTNIRATALARNPNGFLARMPHLAVPAIRWVQGSVTTVRPRDFSGLDFHGVIHLATESDSKATVGNPAEAIDVITGGTQRLLDIAVASGAKRFLFTSSGSVYGRQPSDVELLDETYPGGPDSTDMTDAYSISGEAKRQAELLCIGYADRQKIESRDCAWLHLCRARNAPRRKVRIWQLYEGRPRGPPHRFDR